MRIKRKQPSITSDFEKFLKDYHCKYEVNKEDDGTTIFNFEFQAGYFVASVRKQDDCIEITFPTIASVPMLQLPLVRSKCNDRNNSNILFKYSYSINHEEGEVNVHMSFFNNRFDPESMVHQLKAAFHFQLEWQRDYDEALSISKDYDSIDIESELYNHHREMYLLRRLEMAHEQETVVGTKDLAASTEALRLGKLLETVVSLPDAHLMFMTVNTVDRQVRLEDDAAIRDFDLRRALIEGEGKEARFTRDYAVLDLHYKQGNDNKPLMATISLTAEGEDEHSLYTRVTVTLPMRNASRVNSLNNERRNTHSVSILVALDRADDKQRQQEFNYMWTEAMLKAEGGEKDKMSEDQQLLSRVNNADAAYNLYWGNQYFHNSRYYEAILHLENMYNSYRSHYFEMNGDQKRVFIEAAYKLGFCYNELGMYHKAFYYLDLMANDGNIRHTMALVNAMVASKDLRLFSYTESIMEEVKRNFDENDELPENIRTFINFVRRRRGYAFINFNQLDQAEKIFTQMLNEEENADYAIKELAYIKQLRQQQGGEDAPTADADKG